MAYTVYGIFLKWFHLSFLKMIVFDEWMIVPMESTIATDLCCEFWRLRCWQAAAFPFCICPHKIVIYPTCKARGDGPSYQRGWKGQGLLCMYLEYLGIVLKGVPQILLISYRPPKYSPAFAEDFTELFPQNNLLRVWLFRYWWGF